MLLKDYVATLPIEVITKTEITDTSITLPHNVDAAKFYSNFKNSIKVPEFTAEKAIFAASAVKRSDYISSTDLLVARLYF